MGRRRKELIGKMIRKCRWKMKKGFEMSKKCGNKASRSQSKRARSSVGRAPQWHCAPPRKNTSRLSKLSFPENIQVFEIPDGWEPAVAMREEKGKSVLRRVLLKSRPQKLENDLKAPQRRRSA